MQVTSSGLVRSTSILDDCHRVVLRHLHANMKNMFENSDMAFQEFADKAQSGTSHIRFMEAMGIIQRNHAQVEEVFYRKLGDGFKNFGGPGHSESFSGMLQDEPLMLVSMEDADIQVAIQNMVATATLGSTQVLFELRQRLAVLNNGQKLEECRVPASPVCLAHHFYDAASELDLEHETRLIVYMLFDKFVLSKTFPMYEEYNQHLVKAGLLPNLKYEVRKNPVSAGSRSRGSHSAGSGGGAPAGADAQGGTDNSQSLGDELFSNIMQLLSRRDRQLRGGAPEDGNNQGNHGQGGPAVTTPVPQAELVSVLHQLQLQGQPDIDASISAEQIVAGACHDGEAISSLKACLSAERKQLFTGIDRRRMPVADTQVIDLVGMMFEYLLNEKELPSVAKVELCRLHTPYLKVAIIDKNIFTNINHPAHDLLNTLANAGIQWVFEDNLNRGIFPTLRTIVQRIIDDFDNDLGIFAELLDLLHGKLRDLEVKAAAIEQRARQAAAGKEKLELARSCAAAAVESRVTSHLVPDDIRQALGDIWLDKLMFIYLREAESDNSKAWNLAIQTIENIIWSVEPRNGDRECAELHERLPDMRKQIEQAFETLDTYGSNDNEAQLALIRKFQEIALAGLSVEATLAGDNRDAVPATLQGNAEAEEERYSPEVEVALSQLRQVAFGTWFSIQEDYDDSAVRLKLSWFSKISGNYMFVDGMGVKAAVMSRAELAALIATGKACIISNEQSSFVERAMEAIRHMLSGEQKAFA
ncbi:MAG: DUF1631 family protein [Pseudomonadota bacterium]